MPELNFQKDVAIDLDCLHEEWQTHAQIRHKYAAEISYLEKVAKQAHEKVKILRSKLIREAKEEKLSSADLREAYYRENKEYQAAKENQIEAEYQLAMGWNALKAFDDRKVALENEVKLWSRNYFATPREERQIEGGKKFIEMHNEAIEERAVAQRVELNRRRRK